MLGRVNFKDFDSFLGNFFIQGEVLNHAFFNQESAPSKTLENVENGSAVVYEEKPQEDVFSPLLVDAHKKDGNLVDGDEKNQAAMKLYSFLEECQVLMESKRLLTAYALLNWMTIYLATFNNDNTAVQKKLREASSHLLNGTRAMTQRAADWESRMVNTYGFLALMGFTLTFVELPSVVAIIFSPDMVSDILLNSADILVNASAAYRQFKLNEPIMATINFLGGLQSLLCTVIGIAISINAMINYGLEDEKTQAMMEITENLLGVACALGMFCGVWVEYMEYTHYKSIKNTFLDFLFDGQEIFKNAPQENSLKYLSDPVELLKLCREHVETSLTSSNLTTRLSTEKTDSALAKKISVETLVRGIAIAQAQSRNHLNYERVFFGFSLMMALLAACTFFSEIEETMTPSAIQGMVLLSAILGKYMLCNGDNVKKISVFLEEKTSQEIQIKQDKQTEIYHHSYLGCVENILRIPLNYVHSQLFYQAIKTQSSTDSLLHNSIENGVN